MPARLRRLAAALGFTLALAPAARADLVVSPANLVYNMNSWSFDTGMLNAKVIPADKGVAKALAKLDKFGGNQCIITYDSDSKVEGVHTYYSVFKISKCF